MTNLCYSTFLNLIQKYYSYDIESELLGRDVLSTITPDHFHPKFSRQYLSLFWTRERNIPTDILGFSAQDVYQQQCYDYFNRFIVPDINPITEDDFYYNLENLISNDDTISPRKKASLHRIIESGNKPKYLTQVFLYALTKPNKSDNISLGSDDISLLAEVDQVCPLCYTKLIDKKKGKDIYRFGITRIYPEFLDSSLKTEFDAIKPKPEEPDDIINKICLCDDCSTKYIFNPTTAVYDKLVRIKASFGSKPGLSPISNRFIDEQIVEILKKLKATSPADSVLGTLRMKPIELVNKIPKDNYLLAKAIKDDNDTYFYFIKEHLSLMEEYSSTFEIISSEIRASFLVLDRAGHSHDEIYNQLIAWILRKLVLPSSYYHAVHIIISFFVQNCEVFHEITE